MALLALLPEDVARLVWKKVFDEVVAEIPNKTLKFYHGKLIHYNNLQNDICKKADGLAKRYNKCKRKEQAKIKMLGFANQYVDNQIMRYKISCLFVECWDKVLGNEQSKQPNYKASELYLSYAREVHLKDLLDTRMFKLE